MERSVCVPALCSSSVFEHPLPPGDLSVLLAAWQTGVYEMLNVLQPSLDELKRDWSSIKCVGVCRGEAIPHPDISGAPNMRLSQYD